VLPDDASGRALVTHLCAAVAGIPWYLLAEQESPDALTLRLFRLEGEHYVEHAVAKDGERLRITEPFEVVLDPAALTA
jgi:hypothetical protein